MMSQSETTQQFVHRENIARYKKILGTHLTAEERRFVERRVLEEQTSLQQLAGRIRPVGELSYAT